MSRPTLHLRQPSSRDALDYRHRAEQNRPDEYVVVAGEVRRLAGQGLTPTDIAQALRITVAEVNAALRTDRGSPSR